MWEMRLPRGRLSLSLSLSLIFPSCSWLAPAHLLLSFLLLFPLLLLRLSFRPSIPCLSSCPPIYMPAGPHPFNVLTECWGLPVRFQRTTHSQGAVLFHLLLRLPSSCVFAYLHLYLRADSPIPPPSTTQNPHFAIGTHTHTHTQAHLVFSLPLLLFPLRGFYHTVPGSLSRC